MKKCEHFTNGHCAYECPNTSIDSWEDHFELDARRELGIERISCKECRFFDNNCTCDDCYFKFSKDCPEYDTKSINLINRDELEYALRSCESLTHSGCYYDVMNIIRNLPLVKEQEETNY